MRWLSAGTAGVTAELTELTMLSEEEMIAIKYGGGPLSGHEADRALASILRAFFTVTQSTDPEVPIGSVATVLLGGGMSHAEVRKSFTNCKGPKQPKRLAKLAGKKAECQGHPNIVVED